MTVKELIAKLQLVPNQDSNVTLFTTDGVQENIVTDISAESEDITLYYEEC